jgi:hypothetical protein
MKCSSSACGRIARLLSISFAAGLLSGLVASVAARAQPTQPTPPSATTQPSAEELAKREAWRAAITRTPTPKEGCFTAVYPNTTWQEAPCGPPPRYPNPPARLQEGGPGPVIGGAVGNGHDFSAQPVGSLPDPNSLAGPRPGAVGNVQVSGLISSAVGSFDSVTPSTITEAGPWWGNPPPPPPSCNHPPPCHQPDGLAVPTPEPTADAFSLQLNTKPFPTAACQGVAGCQGWQQFVFSQNQCSGPCVFIEYWLLGFGTCPKGSPFPPELWTQWGNDCFINSKSSRAPAVSAAQLQGTTLTGNAAGDTDTVVLTTASGTAMATAATSVLNLAQGWNTVEWNVFGDCCDFKASFSPGSTLVVRTSVNTGSNRFAPTCVKEGFTGERSNLFLVTTPALEPASTLPAIVFTESNAEVLAVATCSGTVRIP